MIKGSTIQLASGRYFDLQRPSRIAITIRDIAHALSMLCRFNGHCSSFYSVAQHSVYVSQIVPVEYGLSALLHDAAEAFLGDVTSPLKKLLPDYSALEHRIEVAIRNEFDLPKELHPCIKNADLVLLKMEKRDLMPDGGDWSILDGVQCQEWRIEAWEPAFAKMQFLQRYEFLLGQGSHK